MDGLDLFPSRRVCLAQKVEVLTGTRGGPGKKYRHGPRPAAVQHGLTESEVLIYYGLDWATKRSSRL